MPRAFVILLALVGPGVTLAQESAPDFRRDVAPILVKSCLRCHGAAEKEGGLSLATRAAAQAGGDSGPALVPGDPADSLLLTMVGGEEPEMPRQAPPLDAASILVIRKWIEAGASWPEGLVLAPKAGQLVGPWWSLRPLSSSKPPSRVEETHATPVDAFIGARLRQEGIEPSPPADRRTLIRRATFDLHGLPPTPKEVAAFSADLRPDAWERLLDRLLASPRYGERQARRWLDLVHYGDSHGFDKDKPRPNAWPYRDYVVRAFNEDRPFDRFVTEQLAGDVLFPDSPDGIVATGFIAAGPWDFVGHVELREGTRDKAIARNLDRDDMVMTAMSTFSSTTIHCARCHDHKFDAISQVEYYALQAVFAGVERADRDFVIDPEVEALRRKLRARESALVTEGSELLQRVAGHSHPDLERADRELAEMTSALAPWRRGKSPSLGWHSAIMPEPSAVKWVQVDLGESRPIERIVLVPAHVEFGGHAGPGFGFPSRFAIEVSDDPSFASSRVIADHRAKDFPHPGNGWISFRLEAVQARHVRVTATRLWPRTKDWVFALGELLVISGGENVGRGAVVTSLDSIEAAPAWGKANLVDGFDSRHEVDPAPSRSRLTREIALQEAMKSRAATLERVLPIELRRRRDENLAELSKVRGELAELPEAPKVYAAAVNFEREGSFRPSPKPRPVQVLERGDVMRPIGSVQPGALGAVDSIPARFEIDDPLDEGARRVALARWLTHPDNPLTWRSIVNRVWQSCFGRGIVNSANDFGRMGDQPSHPVLLDWLARKFRDDGRSLKDLHRLIMSSAVYRQVSSHRERPAEIDGDNRLLWRMNRRRLEAEAIRDSVLAVSGDLDLEVGGPPVRWFDFADDHSPVYDHAAFDVTADASRRRSLYRFIVRSVPDPFFECLDAADPSQLVARRNETTTALQALALFNNRFMIWQAGRLAARLEREAADPIGRVELALKLVFSRSPSSRESDRLVAHAAKHGLPAMCRVLLNANEFIFVD